MKNNQCTCTLTNREQQCMVHRKKNVRRDFYKYEDEYLTQDYDEDDEQ